MTGTFKVGDAVLLDEQFQVTIRSWPAENIGFFEWSRVNRKDNAEIRGNAWYGETPDGKPVHSAAKLELITEGVPVVSTLPALGSQAPAAEPAVSLGTVKLTVEEYEALVAAAKGAVAEPGVVVPIDGDPENPPVVEPEVVVETVPPVKVAAKTQAEPAQAATPPKAVPKAAGD